MPKFAIQYHSASTVNGQPVGKVYAQDVADAISHYPRNTAWSYVTEPSKATLFDSIEAAEALARTKSWRGVSVVEVE